MNDVFEVRAVRGAHAVNVLLLVATFATAIARHASQPGRIPLHFDLAGLPDRWGEKSWGTTLAVPLVAVGLTALVYAGAWIVGWARRNPAMLNLPDKAAFLALPPSLQEPIWRQLRAMFFWLAVPETLLCLTLVAVVPGDDARLRIWPVFVPVALLVALAAVLTIRVARSIRHAVATGRTP